MIKSYQVLGRGIQLDPNAQYLKPSGVTTMDLVRGTARFEELDAEGFLNGVIGIPPSRHSDLYDSLELHLMECKSVLGFIEATQGDYDARLIVEDGLVEGPKPQRTEELKDGLRNTIRLFEQLMETRR